MKFLGEFPRIFPNDLGRFSLNHYKYYPHTCDPHVQNEYEVLIIAINLKKYNQKTENQLTGIIKFSDN